MTRHSKEDAVDERTFRRLVDACDRLDEPYRSECRFVLYTTGRLGLRAGELAHIDESWIDWDKSMIEIPQYDPCHKGKDGHICGYCRKRAKSAYECNDDLSFEDALKARWEPKTENSARPIPFDFSEKVEDAIEEFFFWDTEYARSRASVNRRVDRVLDAAGLPRDTCYPHSLRATAATFHAYRGLGTLALQALFGWKKIETARKYVKSSGGMTQRALRDAHSDDD